MSQLTKTKTRGLWRSPGGFYFGKYWADGKAKWAKLGDDYNKAKSAWHDIQSGRTKPAASRTTLGQAVEDWLTLSVTPRRIGRAPGLAKSRTTNYLLKFFEPVTTLADITGDHIRAYRNWLDKQDLAPGTVKNVLADLRALLNFAEETSRLGRSPFPRRGIMPKIDEALPKGLSAEEVLTLTTLPDPHGFIWRFLIGTGLRWAEACRAQASHVKGGLLEVERTKSHKARRVPLGATLLAEIQGRVGRLVPFGENSPGSFTRYCISATGLTGIHVHRARHTFATGYLNAGGELAALQVILGHSTIALTQRYAHLTEAYVRADAAKVDRQQMSAGLAAERGSTA